MLRKNGWTTGLGGEGCGVLVHVCGRVGRTREQICILSIGEYFILSFPGPAQISAMSGEPGCILYTGEANKFVPVSALCRPSL